MRELERPPQELAEYGRLQPYVVPGAYPELEPAQPSVSPTHYLRVIWRQRWKILAFVGACMLATYLVCTRLTPIYEATTKLDVDRHVNVTPANPDSPNQTSNDDIDTFLTTQRELILSDAVVRPVAERYKLLEKESQLDNLGTENIRRKMGAPITLRYLEVTRPLNTYLLNISYRSAEPQLAANVANAIAASYIEHTVEIRRNGNGVFNIYAQKQLEELRARMEKSADDLTRFEKEMGIVNPEGKTNLTADRIKQLNLDYSTAQKERADKEAAYNALQNGGIPAALTSQQAGELNRLQERIDAAKADLADASSIYGANNKVYREKAEREAELERQFKDAVKSVNARVESEYHEAVTKEQILARELGKAKNEYDSMSTHWSEYQTYKDRADHDRKTYEDLDKEVEKNNINNGYGGSYARVADRALPPDQPVFPRTRLFLLLTFIGSLVLAICTAILADVMDNTIRDPEQVARALDTSVLGTLPTVKEMRRLINPGAPPNSLEGPPELLEEEVLLGQGVIRYKKEDADSKKKKLKGTSPNSHYEGISSYEEAIRTLRHSILLPDLDRSVKSLLITSATPGEGKSTAIIHLAIAHAEQGKKTLIIDADLRRPSIHKKLNLNGSLGLSNVLLGEFRWKETIVKNEQWPDLDVVPSGTASRRASDLVGSMMADILDEASKEYDLVLVDAPPLLGFAEAMQVAKSVDGVVVMARAGQTSRRAVATVLATLKRLRANVVGLVLNEVDKGSTNDYYYYSDYRKYYSSPDQLG